MAQAYAQKFYKSKAWQLCRDAYAKSQHGLCERCLAKGLYEVGEIVHHKIHLTEKNIRDVDVAMNWDNLELVCRKCHGEEHGTKKSRRYELDEMGRVVGAH